ncbi:PoNe immunity protein domain-containing protein [Comamonas nitrativorans]|uniref:PoNe immunity protein domain-containing protein n=1 Tax=Comamonas nitrativorans TaxID=108437 RepID=A0ABV9H2P0_9BURK
MENFIQSLCINSIDNFNYRDPIPDPIGYKRSLEHEVHYFLKSMNYAQNKFNVTELPEIKNRAFASRWFLIRFDIIQNFLYANGTSIETLERLLIELLPITEKVLHLNIEFLAEENKLPKENIKYSFYKIMMPIIQQALLMVQDTTILKRWMQLTEGGNSPNSSYVGDVLARSFIPDWPISKKYGKLDRYDNIRMHHGLQTVLSAPGKAGKQAGIERYMAQWNGMMRPFGWKPKRNYDPRPGYGDDLFLKFAYEAALVVCGWDLDDSAFRDHPYYPRDLVDYYRAHVRHTRDAWRPEGIGAGIPVMPPPPPKKIDLHKSKAKGYKRWLELTCDGDKNACTDTLEALGTLRSLKNSWDEVLDQLSGNGHAVRADLKDPDTLQAQIDALATQRPLAELTPPDAPPAGPARCEMLMQQATAWAAAQGYTWQALDDGGDNWQAVLIRSEFHAEWLALSAALHLPPGVLGQ